MISVSCGVVSSRPNDFDGRVRKGNRVPSGRPTCRHGCTGVHGATPAKDREHLRKRSKVSRSEAFILSHWRDPYNGDIWSADAHILPVDHNGGFSEVLVSGSTKTRCISLHITHARMSRNGAESME